jgi:hypothetical protein
MTLRHQQVLLPPPGPSSWGRLTQGKVAIWRAHVRAATMQATTPDGRPVGFCWLPGTLLADYAARRRTP